MAKQLSVCRECNAHKAAVFLCLFILQDFFCKCFLEIFRYRGQKT